MQLVHSKHIVDHHVSSHVPCRIRAEEIERSVSKIFGLEIQQACISSSSFYNETLCRRQDRRFRTFSCRYDEFPLILCMIEPVSQDELYHQCSDIPPGPVFSCAKQVSLDKCFRPWLYTEAFCLRSCGRCGSGCIDILPPGSTRCDASLCETDEYIGTGFLGNTSNIEQTLPYCLKTCRRCSVTTTV